MPPENRLIIRGGLSMPWISFFATDGKERKCFENGERGAEPNRA
jgi:hypothetical protein